MDSQPWVTWVIIAACAVVYGLQWLTSGQSMGVTEQFYYAGLHTSAAYMEPWRMLTAAFLHSLGNPLHLLLNMYTLWIMGRVLEPALGWPRYLALYLIAALGGSVAVLWLSSPFVPVVGASGAVYGLFAALFIIMRRTGQNVTGIAVLIAINLGLSFMPGTNISWQGHLGGLVTGALCALIVAYLPRGGHPGQALRPTRRTALIQWGGFAVVTLLLVVLAVIGAVRLDEMTLIQFQLERAG